MVRYFAALLVVALVALTPSPILGLACDYGKEDLKYQGVFVKGQTPVHGYWINSCDVFYYAGDAKAFNQFLEACDKLKKDKLKVVVHAGTTNARSPWDSGPRGVADWSVYVFNSSKAIPTQVDVWVGARLKWQDLHIPAGVEVKVDPLVVPGGKFEGFPASRGKGVQVAPPTSDADVLKKKLTELEQQIAILQQKTAELRQRLATPDGSTEPLRLTVELSDGSRLIGQASEVKNLSLQTGFGKVVIPPGQVESIRFPDDKGATTVRLRNGDKLSGVWNPADWGDLKLLTVIGEVKVPVRLIRLCAIDPIPRKANVSARASSFWEKCTPDRAFDGKRNTDWNAGGYAPAWIEADLGAPTQLASILLIPVQDIPGATTHEVWVSNKPIGDDRRDAKLVHTFQGETKDNQLLQFNFPKGLSARYVQIRTTQSPTWIAWWEVEIRVR
jgi:hypothetical protein